jgi:hypothetical protein
LNQYGSLEYERGDKEVNTPSADITSATRGSPAMAGDLEAMKPEERGWNSHARSIGEMGENLNFDFEWD